MHQATIAELALYQRANYRDRGTMKTTTSTPGLANLGPLDQLKAKHLPQRLLRLLLGLWLYGLAIALLVKGALGAAPWDVFHLGVALHVPLSLGTVMVIAALAVLLAWIPLRQMPGLGTVANTLLLGPFADIHLALLGAPTGWAMQCGFMFGGVLICGFATALYVGAQLGPGPRDGLMTGLARCSGWSIRRVRTLIELAVLAAGIALGGTVGMGTIVFALSVGPITQFFLRYLVVRLDPPEAALV